MDEVKKAQLAAGVRQVALVVGSWAVGRGYLDDDTVAMLATIVAIVVTLVWGQRSTSKLAKSNGE